MLYKLLFIREYAYNGEKLVCTPLRDYLQTIEHKYNPYSIRKPLLVADIGNRLNIDQRCLILYQVL